MRTLLLLRHAKSSWEEPVEDHDRPLSARGRRDAAAVGRLLRDRGTRLDLVVCSTAARTRQTWDEAVAAGASAVRVEFSDDLYDAPVADLLATVRGLPADANTVMLIGHAPGIPGLTEFLATAVGEKFATSGLATLAVEAPWAEVTAGTARLVRFDLPRG